MKRVFVTGVSGYFGSTLVEYLGGKDEIGEIIGIDIAEPRGFSPKLTFIRHDVRTDMYPLLKDRAIDWAVHAAYILPPLHDKGLMEDININGTINFLTSCAKAGIPQLMQCSSTTAYGFHPDNDMPLTEESPLRGNGDFTYCKNKRELEAVCAQFQKEHPEIALTVIRPCFVVGPGFDNPLSRHLQKKIVMVPSKAVPYQFIHEDDLIELMFLLLRDKRRGAYNLAADGVISFQDMIRIMGNWMLPLPYPVMYPLNSLAWVLRLKFITEFPSTALSMIIHPWIASNDKIKDELGYVFKYTTREAFEDFARHVKSRKKSLLKSLFHQSGQA
jgi:UDP-glucose 4-epimerase